MADTNVNKKPLPVSESFFDLMIEDGYYYVDKTLLIKEMLDKKSRVVLCTRPRRFGKTLNQTMLKCFFEDTARIGGKDTRALFRGLKIEEAGERYMEYQGKYPVIFLSFKEVKRDTFESSYHMLKECITDEFERHAYVAEKISGDNHIEKFKRISSGSGSIDDYSYALRFLSECLEKYHGRKVVILIDEYDVPLENSWSRGFYQKMIDFIRPILSSALKDNPHLQLAVMTGCLRISKESIFTGLNNLEVVSILSDSYSEHFGFTQIEADAMLKYYELESKTQILKDWYNGYLFGSTEVYNPLSTVRVVKAWTQNIKRYPEPHWVNTSSNDIIRRFVDTADSEMKTDLETLMAGGAISKVVHEDITYKEIDDDIENLWNFLFFTGYLKKVGDMRQSDDGELTLDLSIPNIELKYIYKTKIQEWFKKRIKVKNLDALHNAVLNGDAETFQKELSAILSESISYMDNAESFYHGLMIGALARLENYRLKSNRESGEGRSDLVLYNAGENGGKAIIFEFKLAPNAKALSTACEDALKQIEDKNYAAYWDEEDYKCIIKYGIGFYKKRCEIRKG
ncbi:MAG: ATP-binding protein [Chitinispirillales bacterium]|jgi:hypothetical protein|nr:ATP-binding protein [Chitinispirillales bacterium]